MRLHGLRGERSNVPREAWYFTERRSFFFYIVWGTSNRGKSQSIKQLALSFPFSSIIRPWDSDNYDSYVIGAVKDSGGKDRIVGIESLGDPRSYQKEWLGAFTKENCEVIVFASRSYGQTYDDVAKVARNNGYEIIEVTTHYHVNGNPVLSNGVDLIETFASNMKVLIMECLR